MLSISTFVYSLIALSVISGAAFLFLLVIGSVNSRFEEEHVAGYWLDTPSTESYDRGSDSTDYVDESDGGKSIERAA